MAKTAVLDAPVRVSVYLEEWMVEELKRRGGGNVSKGTRDLLTRHLSEPCADQAQESVRPARGK